MTGPSEQSAGWGSEPSPADSFVALADTLLDDVDVLDLLDQLVRSRVELLGATAVDLLLRDPKEELKPAASTGEESRLLELLQLQWAQGPCLEAVAAGRPVTVDELCEVSARWPEFAKAADALGFVSAYAFPLRLRQDTVGGLNLFCSEAGALAEADRRLAQALADVATIGAVPARETPCCQPARRAV